MTPVFDSISPNTGRPFARWEEVGAAQAEARIARVDRASAALLHDPQARRAALDGVSAALQAGREELVALTVQEGGKTPAEAAGEVDYAESFLATSRHLLDTYPFSTAMPGGRTVREVPRGTGLLIAPFNDPVAGLTRKIGPCLAAGAGALVKPSELGMQVALAFARHISAAGLDDLVAMLPLADRGRIAATIADARIGTVSFTGSTRAGLALAVEAARHAKGFVGELGGTNPFVILQTADLDSAVADLVARKIKAAGQACSAPNLVLAERPVADEVALRLEAALGALVPAPSDTGSAAQYPASGAALGPVRTAGALSRLAAQAAALEATGARRLGTGIAEAPAGTPFLAHPTAYVLDAPGPFLHEEAFGPLMGVTAFDDRATLRAILAANAQPLVLYLYGAEPGDIEALTGGLRYGSIGLDTTAVQSPDAPTGGFRNAGIGREGGRWGLAEFLTTINTRTATPEPGSASTGLSGTGQTETGQTGAAQHRPGQTGAGQNGAGQNGAGRTEAGPSGAALRAAGQTGQGAPALGAPARGIAGQGIIGQTASRQNAPERNTP